ncbi:FAD-dependent thymidylate synthase [Rickettsiales endosymbiont of Peranema trichophorum]|uniref:FAD-dependent thymidylate synthase n=1 Tax=Rickettsiales endosymbiont of Peranema trichophorum TaxID=2486577 RepID=UPI001023A007|nr:FAD-dependent thymidylate synthase [Rickettsiales endosymbiont of Peranema trichophorum]RZI47669.1 FAD-dependent thymidylate synthase [Rickettsiales endosymbiont of Peranema trichophorum]
MQKDVEILRSKADETFRVTVSAIEQIIYEPFQVLDHGFVRVIDYMGDDAAIVQAARVSYGRGTKKTTEDQALINYLMRHAHTTPFEMCEIKLHVKLPIFVARQWLRHRTASVNEYSARYSILDKEFYVPAQENLAAQSTSNKQGRAGTLSGEEARRVLDIFKNDSQQCYNHYVEMMNIDDVSGDVIDEDRSGLTRELARINLPVSSYTQLYWKIDLHNLLHFLRLRSAPGAQYEIREYAKVILDIVKKWVPFTYDAFVNYKLNAATISANGLEVIRRMLRGENVSELNSGLSKREWSELMAQIGI